LQINNSAKSPFYPCYRGEKDKKNRAITDNKGENKECVSLRSGSAGETVKIAFAIPV
jgi:hypothetical protein